MLSLSLLRCVIARAGCSDAHGRKERSHGTVLRADHVLAGVSMRDAVVEHHAAECFTHRDKLEAPPTSCSSSSGPSTSCGLERELIDGLHGEKEHVDERAQAGS
jgi:L-lactate utilization protein LutC